MEKASLASLLHTSRWQGRWAHGLMMFVHFYLCSAPSGIWACSGVDVWIVAACPARIHHGCFGSLGTLCWDNDLGAALWERWHKGSVNFLLCLQVLHLLIQPSLSKGLNSDWWCLPQSIGQFFFLPIRFCGCYLFVLFLIIIVPCLPWDFIFDVLAWFLQFSGDRAAGPTVVLNAPSLSLLRWVVGGWRGEIGWWWDGWVGEWWVGGVGWVRVFLKPSSWLPQILILPSSSVPQELWGRWWFGW